MVIYVQSEVPPGNIRLHCRGDEHDDIQIGTYITFFYPNGRWSDIYRITEVSRERVTTIQLTRVERTEISYGTKIISMTHVGEWSEHT